MGSDDCSTYKCCGPCIYSVAGLGEGWGQGVPTQSLYSCNSDVIHNQSILTAYINNTNYLYKITLQKSLHLSYMNGIFSSQTL